MKLVLLIFATVIMQSAVLGNTFIGLVATQENSKDELPLPCMIMMIIFLAFTFIIRTKRLWGGGSDSGSGFGGCGGCGGCGGGD